MKILKCIIKVCFTLKSTLKMLKVIIFKRSVRNSVKNERGKKVEGVKRLNPNKIWIRTLQILLLSGLEGVNG